MLGFLKKKPKVQPIQERGFPTPRIRQSTLSWWFNYPAVGKRDTWGITVGHIGVTVLFFFIVLPLWYFLVDPLLVSYEFSDYAISIASNVIWFAGLATILTMFVGTGYNGRKAREWLYYLPSTLHQPDTEMEIPPVMRTTTRVICYLAIAGELSLVFWWGLVFTVSPNAADQMVYLPVCFCFWPWIFGTFFLVERVEFLRPFRQSRWPIVMAIFLAIVMLNVVLQWASRTENTGLWNMWGTR